MVLFSLVLCLMLIMLLVFVYIVVVMCVGVLNEVLLMCSMVKLFILFIV